LQQFFDQWIYRAGHPEFEIEYSLEKDSRKLKIKITQAQAGDTFEFPLEIRLIFTNDDNDKKPETVQVSEKVAEYSFDIPKDAGIRWISIDPEFKILKEIKSIKITNETSQPQVKEILKNQLRYGNTVLEKIQAARGLQNIGDQANSDDVIETLQNTVLKDSFWGVAAEAANTLGTINSSTAYKSLKECISSAVQNPKSRVSVVQALGNLVEEFGKENSLDLFKSLLQDESYFVATAAAVTIGKTRDEQVIGLLKELVETTHTYQNVLARGAIAGLSEFSFYKNNEIAIAVAQFLIKKSSYGNDKKIRQASTRYLGKFIANDEQKIINYEAFNVLINLLKDNWVFVRLNACTALVDAFHNSGNLDVIAKLQQVAQTDRNPMVRRAAEISISKVKKMPVELAARMSKDEIDKIKSKTIRTMQRRILDPLSHHLLTWVKNDSCAEGQYDKLLSCSIFISKQNKEKHLCLQNYLAYN
jgi:aminopeptidase N